VYLAFVEATVFPAAVVQVRVSLPVTDVAVKLALTGIAVCAPPSMSCATATPAPVSAAIAIAAMVSLFIRLPSRPGLSQGEMRSGHRFLRRAR
jgi:hypothetical protein